MSKLAQPMAIQAPIRGIGISPFSALRDIFAGLSKWQIWTALSWQEFRSTYRRSALGILWVTLSFAGFVFIKLTIFSSLLDIGIPGYYDTYLLIGFFIWFYLAQSINAAPDTFISNQGWIKSEPLPLTTYIYKNILRESYTLVFTSIVVVSGIFFIGYPVELRSIGYSLLAFPFYFVSAFASKLLLGTLGARFRDISHLIKAIMLPMMFLTPIFWMPSQMESLMQYLWWNPLFHYVEIFRAPLLEGTLPYESWKFVGIFFGITIFLAFALFSRFRQRIVYWF